MGHDELCKEADKAITAVFNDTSVPKEITRESLEELADNINMMLDAMEND